MATTQANRLMAISTPLGEDFLLLNKLTASEGLSELFSFEVEVLHEETEAGYAPTIVDANSILGQSATIFIQQKDGTKREFNGMVNQFSQGTRHTRFSFYYLTIVPHVWLLTQNFQSRIFQQKSVPEILKEVFNGFEVAWEIQGKFEPRNYCVQYRESDFDFASRLMEEEGIYYYFEHKGGKHKMIVANTPESHRDCPAKSSIPFFIDVSRIEDFVTSINTWQIDYQLQTGKITLWDHNFELPHSNLAADKPSMFKVADNQKLEFYDYPGGYSRKYDGISKDGGEQPAELEKIFEDNQRTAGIRMQALDVRHKTASAHSDCSSLTAGYRFSLIRHPNSDANGKYVITSIVHEAEQNPSYISEEETEQPYKNTFHCIPYVMPYRPDTKTPKPVIYGTQTAVVVGPAGEEIFTDKYGRVKVQFNWDRHGRVDSNSSCWIRVAQNWASKRWGMMFIPRIGMEVVVHFLEGDPDQPIITGSVYNAETMPPYTLPDEKTKMTIKSNSSKGGDGFNELRFEDKKGEEQIFIHAEKNLDIDVNHDAMESIGNESHLTVGTNYYVEVGKDKHQQIGGDKTENVGASVYLTAGSKVETKAGSKFAVDAGQEIHLNAGMNVTIEAGTTLTLQAGGNYININSSGIYIQGTMVMINSGGAAGSGSGSNPDKPKKPKAADKAKAGAKVKQKKPPPPPSPYAFTKLAVMQIQAALKQAAFARKKAVDFINQMQAIALAYKTAIMIAKVIHTMKKLPGSKPAKNPLGADFVKGYKDGWKAGKDFKGPLPIYNLSEPPKYQTGFYEGFKDGLKGKPERQFAGS